MKFLDKLGLAIFSILILTISILLLLIGFNFMEPTIFSVLIAKVLISQKATYIMIGVCIILILLALKCLFFRDTSYKDKDEGILLQNNDGKLLITKTTLENLVEGVVKEFPSIENASSKVIFDKENNVFINVTINVKEGTVIKDVSSKLQTKIKENIKKATDLELNSVDIEVQNVQAKKHNEDKKED